MPQRPKPADPDEVFKDFRDEVSRESAVAEAEQRYKLALTYRDMGMIDDAMRELEAAVRAPRLRFEAASLLGRLAVERQQPSVAIEWFERAAEAPAPDPGAARALLYDLGVTLETVGEHARALSVFQGLAADAVDFRDTAARIARLSGARADE